MVKVPIVVHQKGLDVLCGIGHHALPVPELHRVRDFDDLLEIGRTEGQRLAPVEHDLLNISIAT